MGDQEELEREAEGWRRDMRRGTTKSLVQVMVNRGALGRVVRALERILEATVAEAEDLKRDPAYAYLIDAVADCKLALRAPSTGASGERDG